MAEHLRLINDESPERKWGMVMTSTAQEILRSIHHVRQAPGRLTMIAAVPGAGKSEALLRYVQNEKHVLLHTTVAAEGKVWDVAAALMEKLDLGIPNSRKLRAERTRIAEAIGVESLLMIDEAQYLAHKNPRGGNVYETLEWLRAMAEEGCFSLVYAGDLALLDAVGHLPQLQRRMSRPVIVRHVPKADVAAIAGSLGVSDREIIKALYGVSTGYGGLGDVVNVIRHAKLFAGGDAVAEPHIMAAIEDLKLTPKGGRK